MHEETRNSYVCGFNFPDRQTEEPSTALTHTLMFKFKHYCPQRFCRKHNKPEHSTKMNQSPNLRLWIFYFNDFEIESQSKFSKFYRYWKLTKWSQHVNLEFRDFRIFFFFYRFSSPCVLNNFETNKSFVCHYYSFFRYPLMFVSPRLELFGMLNIFNHRGTPKSSCTCLRYASIIECVYLWEDYGQTSASCNLWPGNIPHVIGSWVMSLNSLMASLEGWRAASPPLHHSVLVYLRARNTLSPLLLTGKPRTDILIQTEEKPASPAALFVIFMQKWCSTCSTEPYLTCNTWVTLSSFWHLHSFYLISQCC